MGLLKNLVAKIREKNNRAGDIEDEFRAQSRAREKMMSADERELESYIEEQRKKDVKKQLAYFRKKKQEEDNRNFMIDKHNIFNGQKDLFNNERRIFLNG